MVKFFTANVSPVLYGTEISETATGRSSRPNRYIHCPSFFSTVSRYSSIASTPLEVYAAIRRRERAGGISAEDATAALDILRLEAARMVQEPLNPAVLEAARQLLDRTSLRWPDTLQLAAALVARDMFQNTEIIFVSASPHLLEAAKAEGFHTLDPAREAHEPVIAAPVIEAE